MSLRNLWERYPAECKNPKFETVFAAVDKQELVAKGIEYHNYQAIRKIAELMRLAHVPEQFSSLLEDNNLNTLVSKSAPLISNQNLTLLFGFLGNYSALIELRKQTLVDYHFEKKDLDLAFWINNYAKVAHTFLSWSTSCGGDARQQAVKDLEGGLQTETVLTHFKKNPYLSQLPEDDLLKLMAIISPVRSPYGLIHFLESMLPERSEPAYYSSFSNLFGVEGGISSFRGIENQCVQIPNSRHEEYNASISVRNTAKDDVLFLLFDKQMRAAYAQLHPESKDSFNYICSLFVTRFINYSRKDTGGHLNNALPHVLNSPLFVALCSLKLIAVDELLDEALKVLFVHEQILKKSKRSHTSALKGLLMETSTNQKDYRRYYKTIEDYEQQFSLLRPEQYDGVVKRFLSIAQKAKNEVVSKWASEVLAGKRHHVSNPQPLKSQRAYLHFTGDEGKNTTEDLRLNDNWYTTEALQYLVHNHAYEVKTSDLLVFVSESPEQIEDELIILAQLRSALNRPVAFIMMEPGLMQTSHFVAGFLSTDNQLLIVNPMGLTQHADFYAFMKKIKESLQLKAIYCSTNKLQQDEHQLVSCGPLCVELLCRGQKI